MNFINVKCILNEMLLYTRKHTHTHTRKHTHETYHAVFVSSLLRSFLFSFSYNIILYYPYAEGYQYDIKIA